MEIILTEDVAKLGRAGDVVRVKPGYARNYLLPRGKALLATRGRVKELDHKKRLIEERRRKEIGGHEELARRLAELELEFRAKAGEEGKLFGSVTTADIAQELESKGIAVDRRKIELEEPIKKLGDYEVPVRLHREVTSQIKVKVVTAEE